MYLCQVISTNALFGARHDEVLCHGQRGDGGALALRGQHHVKLVAGLALGELTRGYNRFRKLNKQKRKQIMVNPYLDRVHKDPPLHQESYMGIIELYALDRSHVLPLANQPSIALTQTIKGHLITKQYVV